MSTRPVKGLTLLAIDKLRLPTLHDFSLREIAAAVQLDPDCQPVNPGERQRHHRAPLRYRLPDVERSCRRMRKGDLPVFHSEQDDA